MTIWENKIIDAFINHYFASAPESLEFSVEERNSLRIRTSVFFPSFDSAHPDEKESYLEAAESLERKGVIRLKWEKHAKGEKLKVLSCEDFEKLFKEAGRQSPKTEAEEIRGMFAAKAKQITSPQVIALVDFLSVHFGLREIGQGINMRAMEELARLLEFCSDPAQLEKITIRALSVMLYRDSKRLEELLSICKPLLSRAEKSVPAPYLLFLERSFPETMISGKIIIEYKEQKLPLTNAGGHILGIPLENAKEIDTIKLISEKKEKTVLTIENKETFYALGNPQKHNVNKNLSRFDCFLYAAGYSNRAAVALVKALSASGFSFYHAGDLDPDGVLILQHIQEIAQRPVTPERMDASTFEKYRAWGRTLSKPMLHQLIKIKKETKAIPELAGLLQRIEETGLGIEQEIIDYRFS